MTKVWFAEEFNRAYEQQLQRALEDSTRATTTWVSQRVAECMDGLGMPGDVARLLEARIEKALREALEVGLDRR